MADRGNPKTTYAADIVYEVYRRSTWLRAFYRNIDAMFQMSQTVVLADMNDNIQVDHPADQSALESKLARSTATLTDISTTRKLIRANAQINKMQEREAGAGPAMQANLNQKLAIKLALALDDKLAEFVAGLTYDTVNGSGNDNSLLKGTAGSIYVSRSFPYKPTGTNAVDLVIEGLKDAHMLLAEKDCVSGETVGAGEAMPMCAKLPLGMARQVVDSLEKAGDLQYRTDIAAQAGADRGILSTSAYMGTWAGIMDIAGTTSLKTPTGTGNWTGYLFPTNGPISAAISEPDIADQDWDQGNTDGEYVHIREGISRWTAVATRNAHVVRIQVHAD